MDETAESNDMPPPTSPEPTAPAPHTPLVRLTPLVFGLAFCAIGVTALVVDVDRIDIGLAWLWALALAVLGVGGLVGSLDGLRRSRRSSG